MSLAGEGAVAIWHDIAPEARDEFYAWHGKEHMPERVAIPGFSRGRRYLAVRADLEYFNLYEADSTAVVTGEEYRRRLDNPTPWTLSTVRHFRRVARSICQVAVTRGAGQGGLVGTWRYDVPEPDAAAHVEAMSSILTAVAEQPIVAGAHLLVADKQASGVDSAERKARGEANRVPRWIAIIEGWADLEPFEALCTTALSESVLAGAGARGASEVGLYALQATVARSDLAAVGTEPRAP